MQAVAAQVEKAIGEPDVLGIFLIAEHRQRQFPGFGEDIDHGGENFDFARGQFGVFRAGGSGADGSINPDHPFGAQPFRRPEGRGIGIGDNLGEAIVIAQVDEQEPAMIADPVDPAGKAHLPADVRRTQLSAGVSSINMHAGDPGEPITGPEKRMRAGFCQASGLPAHESSARLAIAHRAGLRLSENSCSRS
jgi:hypothetical protein